MAKETLHWCDDTLAPACGTASKTATWTIATDEVTCGNCKRTSSYKNNWTQDPASDFPLASELVVTNPEPTFVVATSTVGTEPYLPMKPVGNGWSLWIINPWVTYAILLVATGILSFVIAFNSWN